MTRKGDPEEEPPGPGGRAMERRRQFLKQRGLPVEDEPEGEEPSEGQRDAPPDESEAGEEEAQEPTSSDAEEET
jgi:hypothetical protein